MAPSAASAASKIISRKALPALAARLKKQGKRLVTLNGSFDLLHAGHLHILSQAKHQGDVLIVGLNSDASIHKYKSKDRPIIPQKYRAQMLAAIADVDYVVLMDEAEIAGPLLRLVKPKIHANGSEYGKDCVEAPIAKEVGAKIYIVKRIPSLSTTEIIAKILKVYGKK